MRETVAPGYAAIRRILMVLTPPERKFTDTKGRKGLKDVDAAARARKLQALGWALYGGVPLGGMAGFLAGRALGPTGAWVPVLLVLGLALGPILVFSLAMGVAEVAGKGASTLYMPSAKGTRKKEYSRAQALVVRGEYEDAIRAFEVEILDEPSEPEPYLRIARIHRDQLKDHDQALTWFRRATREAELSGGQEIRTRREIAEIFLHHKRESRKAAPELARLVEGYGTTPDGEWAAAELARIKKEIAEEG